MVQIIMAQIIHYLNTSANYLNLYVIVTNYTYYS